MKIGYAVPPTAAPLSWSDLRHGLTGIFSPDRSIQKLKDEIRRHFGVRHVFLVSSGTAALTLTLKALRSSSRKTEVVIPAYTCPSVPAAVLKAGLRPRLCDIDVSTLDFDHALLEEALNSNTLCVIAHHLFGIASDIDRIRALCRLRGILVVEDAAQAMGVESKGRSLGTVGDVGIFSLGRGKNITCGSGGIIVTNSDQIAESIGPQYTRLAVPRALEALKDFCLLALMAAFVRPSLYWIPAALPFLKLGQTIYPKDIPLKRLSGMNAGTLDDWHHRLMRSNRVRSESASDFSRRLSLALIQGPSHPYLRLPIFVATPEDKNRLHLLSQKRGLGLSLGYPTPINEIPELRRAFDGQRFPAARSVAETLLTIPTHEWLSEKDKQDITECVATTAGGCHTLDAWVKAS